MIMLERSSGSVVAVAICLWFTVSTIAVAQTCVDDVTGRSNVCTANDVSLTSLTVSNVTDGCVSSSDTATVDIQGSLLAGTNRFDIGIFVARDGGDAFTGSCSHDYLPPPLIAPPGHDPGSGTGPYAELEGSRADACGDILSGETTLRDLGGIVVACADTDGDGFVDVGNCVSWDNQAASNCSGIGDAVPGTKSKCNCSRINTNLGIPEMQLTKSCVPDTARPGETVSCTITYSNVGTGPGDFLSFVDDYSEAQGTVSNLVGPGGDSVVDDGSTITWSPGGAPAAQANVPPGATGTLTYDFTLSGSLTNGETVTNTVTAHWKDVPQPSLAVTEVTNVTTTAALLSSFDVLRHEGGDLLVLWETVSESRTGGFFVERWDPRRQDFMRLHAEPLPAVLQPQGGRYRFVDGTPEPGGAAVYRLIEVEFDGVERTVGTFRRTIQAAGAGSSYPTRMYSRAARTPDRLERARRAGRATERRRSGARGPAAASVSPRLKLYLRQSGIHRVTDADIAGALGLPAGEASDQIRRGRVRLERRGEEIPWLASDDFTSLSFYAPPRERDLSLDDVVWLELAPGTTLRPVPRSRRPRAASGRTFRDSLRVEEDRIAAVALGDLDPSGDFWFWKFLSGSAGASSSFELWVYDPEPAPATPTVIVDLRGFQQGAEHVYAVALNGVALGEVRFEGDVPHSASLDVPAGVLRHGANVLSVTAQESGRFFLGAFVDGFTIEYTRRYRAVGDSLDFDDGGNGTITVEGFTSPDIEVWDVTDPLRPALVPSLQHGVDGAWQATFETGSGTRYVAQAGRPRLSPHRTELVERSRLRSALDGVDYVIVVPREMEIAARSFARYRAGTGYRPLVVTVEEVMDEFSGGVTDPRGIRELLRVVAAGAHGGPAYVLLAGNGTYDYRDLQGTGTNLVPPLLRSTESGLVASDAMLADVAGDDGVPDLAIGRVPAVTTEQLEAYFDKVRRLEAESSAGDGSWRRRLVFVADGVDRAGNFPADSRKLAGAAGARYDARFIHLDETHGVENARASLRDQWNEGALVVSYVGHGSMVHWAHENVLDAATAAHLANGERLPLVLGLTCHMGRFDLPGFQPLASTLLLNPSGGASAVISSSGASVNARASRIGEHLIARVLEQNRTVGQALLHLYREVRGDAATLELLRTYNLLGDPALRLAP